MKIFFASFLLLSLAACSQSKAKQRPAASAPNQTASAGLPLGKYAVYQSTGYGFSYQYEFFILNGHQYKMYGKTGEYTYSPATHGVRFTSGEIHDFSGVFTQIKHNNETGKPMIVLDFMGTGAIPDTLQLQHKGWGKYQYAYYRAGEK